MHSRGNYHNRPPHEWGRPYANDWDGYHDNIAPPPRQRPPGPPPPEYDPYYDRPPPRHPDDRLPPQNFHNDYYYNDFEQAPPQRHPPRGRGRGQNGGGRGQSYSRGRGAGNSTANGPKKLINEERVCTGSKPAWLSKPISNSTSTTTNITNNTSSSTASSSTSSSKPAWLTQATTSATTSNNTSSNQLSTIPPPTAKAPTSPAKPSIPTSKPLSPAPSAKPAWLAQTVNNTNSNTSSASSAQKPAWMSATIKTTTEGASTTTNSSSTSTATMNNKPQNNAKPKPKWLTQSSGIKPILKTAKLPASQPAADVDTLPPPPPPPCPPPANQPNIHTQFQQQQNYSYTAQPSMPTVVVQTRPARKVKDDSEVKGTVALPGQKNYISYKNTLQEFCQKRGLSVPSYKCFKNGYGFSATVEIYTGKKIRSSGIQKERKEAEQCAAFEALKNIELLPPDSYFINPSAGAAKAGAKRQMPSPQTVAKKLKNEIPPSLNMPNYKAQLNEFCQKFHLPVPTYETTSSAGGYVTKVFYNKKEYYSTCPHPSKRAAEMNVAQLVLSKVNQAPPPSEPIKGPIVYPNFVLASSNTMGSTDYSTPSTGTTSQPTATPIRSVQDLGNLDLSPIISYKNKLQEACQKRKTVLPTYSSYKDGHLHCCSVVVQGQTFTATGCKTKKGAEQSAARVALEALGLLNE